MKKQQSENLEPGNVLCRIKRGLAGYLSYLAACEMNGAFSEYVLYEPMLRILMNRGYSVECEYPCPGVIQPNKGDKKRLDFFAVGHSIKLAIEVKWAKSNRPKVKRDIDKLLAFMAVEPEVVPLLCVFGRKSHIEHLKLPEDRFVEQETMVTADLKKTRFSCRIYQLKA